MANAVDIPVYDLLNNSVSQSIENTLNKSEIYIYPNPVNKNSQLNIKSSCTGECIISDLSGKKIATTKIYNGNNQVSIQELESGIYIIECKANGKSKTEKLIVN